MIIEKVDPIREAFSDYSAEGTVLKISKVTVDLAAEESDQEVIISFGTCNGMVHRGLKPCCQHVADVIIPPRKYEAVEVDGPPTGSMEATSAAKDGKAGGPETHMEMVPVPLNMDTVTLKLWPIVDESQSEVNHQMMEAVEEDENVSE
jgi:hypothetical protein